jgi:SAM-dependent methyltransferase
MPGRNRQTVRCSTATGTGEGFETVMLSDLTGRILNLGAGTGIRKSEVINVDHVAPALPGGTYVVADGACVPFREGAFHCALLKDVLEHTLEPIAVMAEVHRVVSRGGRASVTVPRDLPRAVWADPTHIRGFTAGALTNLLQLAGWGCSKPRRLGGFPGAGRLGLQPHLVSIMRIPVLGHYFGTNWWVIATRKHS